jgi:hypothetical protein
MFQKCGALSLFLDLESDLDQKSLEWSNPKNIEESQVEIHVDSNIKYQKMLGLGSSFEHYVLEL